LYYAFNVSETTRFAPSPTGLLHLGHAFAAIAAHAAAGSGRFLLRIEDLDRGRSRDQFIAAIVEDLHWLGLSWEEPVLQQSLRSDAYRLALAKLEQLGLLYPCFCSRREIADEIAGSVHAPHAAQLDSSIYPGTCRALSDSEREQRSAAGERFAIRLDAQKASTLCGALTFEELGNKLVDGMRGHRGIVTVNPVRFGDFVMARKDLPASYHLAVVVDDAFQGVTLVTRGSDLFSATHVQRVLQSLLGLPQPRYAHHRLILDEGGGKFSKRDQAVTLRSLRESGVTPEQVRHRIGAGR
jgi:glutamyl-Q tRNA(Asp) synthetase